MIEASQELRAIRVRPPDSDRVEIRTVKFGDATAPALDQRVAAAHPLRLPVKRRVGGESVADGVDLIGQAEPEQRVRSWSRSAAMRLIGANAR
jgi:hypothetical protein